MRTFFRTAWIATAATFGFIAMAGSVQPAFAQGQPQAAQKKVKDQAEYDLFNSVAKETDPEKKLKLLDQWREKYPDSDFKDERLQYYTTVNHPEKVLEAGKQILDKDATNATALYLLTLNVTKIAAPTPDQLAAGETAAKGILANLDKLKPANLGEEQWKKARAEVETMAKGTLMWISMLPGVKAMQAKDYPGSEKEFTKVLQQFPNYGEASYLLGSAIISQRNPEKLPQALYSIARSVALDPAQGGIADEKQRKERDAYLTKMYTNFHGSDEEGLKKLKEQAKASAFPPEGFTIKSASQIAAEKEEEFKKSNPQLALWMSIKKELAAANGEQYFESNVKNAKVPKLKGTVVGGKPPVNSKELQVGIENAQVAEVTLKLDAAIKGKPKPGNVIEWEGVPSAFAKEPFMVSFDVEKADISGLETEAAPAPVKKAVPKKAGTKKK